MRMAWIIIISVLPVSLLLHILTFHDYINAFTLSEVFVILVLAASHKDFNRVSNPINLKWGFIIASISLFMVLLNTALGLLMMETHYKNIDDFMDSVIRSFQLFFYMDVSVIEPKTRAAKIFGQSAIALNWISLISALFLILKPLVYQPIVSLRDREKVRNYLSLYGDNPTSYVSIEEDKKYYFGSNVEGAIVYVVAAGVAVCVGDPVCRQEDAVILLSEFISFCRQNELDICFCQTTENMLSIYKDMRFGITKYGEGEECKPITSLALELIYEHLNNFYGFKTLHQYKRKYGPTTWEPRYLAYYPGVFTPKIAYSIIKVQNPKGVKDYILQQIKLLYQNRKV